MKAIYLIFMLAISALFISCGKPVTNSNVSNDVVIDNPSPADAGNDTAKISSDAEIKKVSQDFIFKLSEYSRNNGSNLRYIKHNQLPGIDSWNVVYKYDVHTENLPSTIIQQDVHLLVQNGVVQKYVVMDISNNTVS